MTYQQPHIPVLYSDSRDSRHLINPNKQYANHTSSVYKNEKCKRAKSETTKSTQKFATIAQSHNRTVAPTPIPTIQPNSPLYSTCIHALVCSMSPTTRIRFEESICNFIKGCTNQGGGSVGGRERDTGKLSRQKYSSGSRDSRNTF